MDAEEERAPARYESGDRINDRYRIEGELGGGGYSMVYEAYDEYLDETVALKVFAPKYGIDPARREVQALRSVSHPNVVPVIDVGRTATRPSQWYLKLGLLRGQTLREVLEQRNCLGPAEVRGVAQDLLSALRALHPDAPRIQMLLDLPELTPEQASELASLQREGLVHRDIKPGNMLLTDHGAVLIDFNLATPVGQDVETRSLTPEYSPPLVDVQRWDVHPDLHAAAVTIYESACGALLSPDADDVPDVDGLPAGFGAVISRGRRRPPEGYASAAEMLASLEGLDWDVEPAGLPAGPPSVEPTDSPRKLEIGSVHTGTVSQVGDYGIVVDIDGHTGRVHVSEMSWGYVAQPSDVVTVGDEVQVLVLDIDADRNRAILSIKQLVPDPWQSFAAAHAVGDWMRGRVVSIAPYGAFVEVAEGIQGLVHVSEMAEGFVQQASDAVAEGEDLWVRLLKVDLPRRRMAFSLRVQDDGNK